MFSTAAAKLENKGCMSASVSVFLTGFVGTEIREKTSRSGSWERRNGRMSPAAIGNCRALLLGRSGDQQRAGTHRQVWALLAEREES